MTNGRFLRPESFDLAAFWQNWTQRLEKKREQLVVTLQVAPTGLQTLQSLLGDAIHHHVAHAEADEKGWLTMTLTFWSLEDACRQLLGIGTAVKIVEPATLRRQMAEQARQIAAAYSA